MEHELNSLVQALVYSVMEKLADQLSEQNIDSSELFCEVAWNLSKHPCHDILSPGSASTTSTSGPSGPMSGYSSGSER